MYCGDKARKILKGDFLEVTQRAQSIFRRRKGFEKCQNICVEISTFISNWKALSIFQQQFVDMC